MALTPDGTPYVESSDLVANYPGLSLALANHIDGLDGGKVLQVVRATDSTNRTTNSLTYVDVPGMTVTITLQKITSSILLIATGDGQNINSTNDECRAAFRIADSSDNGISGAQSITYGVANMAGSGTRAAEYGLSIFGYVTPNTLSAVTYKLRFLSNSASMTAVLYNGSNSSGQMYAIEVAA
jgi:hypothetical protein